MSRDSHVDAGSLSLAQVHARDKIAETMETSVGLEGDIDIAQNVGEWSWFEYCVA